MNMRRKQAQAQGGAATADAKRAARKARGVVRGLQAGIKALKQVGGQEDLIAAMQALLAKTRTEAAARAKQAGLKPGKQAKAARARKAQKEREPKPDAEALAARLQVLRTARAALREGGKQDAAAALERAIHSGELLMEGRKDPEARAIYGKTPPLRQLVAHLSIAAKLWKEYGHSDKAKQVMQLAGYYSGRAQRGNAERAAAERTREAERRRDAEHKQEAERARAVRAAQAKEERRRRVRQRDGDLSEQLREMREEIDALRAMVQDLRKAVDASRTPR